MLFSRVGTHVRSNVIGYLCLFWLMSGTAVAATQLAAHSVGAAQLKTRAVTNAKLADGAVTAAKVKAGSLLAKDFRVGQLPAGAPGAAGQPGPAGAPGPKGDRGPAGPTITAAASRFWFNQKLPTDGTMVAAHLGDAEAGGVPSQLLHIPFAARVFVTAAVNVENVSPTDAAQAACKPEIGPDTKHGTMLAHFSVVDMAPRSAATSGTGNQVSATISVVWSFVVPAGTYDVWLECDGYGKGTPELYAAALNVLATPS